jgi:hypothetical protein
MAIVMDFVDLACHAFVFGTSGQVESAVNRLGERESWCDDAQIIEAASNATPLATRATDLQSH